MEVRLEGTMEVRLEGYNGGEVRGVQWGYSFTLQGQLEIHLIFYNLP